MKLLRIVFIALTAWTFLIGQAMAGQEPDFPDTSPPIKEEHQFLADQLNQQTGGKVRIKTYAKTGNVNYIGVDPSNAIRQPSILGPKPTPEEAARGFLSVYGPLFGLKDQARELKMIRTKTADRGRFSVRFQQVHSGVPIFGGESIVQLDSSNNIISAHSKILPDIDIDTSPVTSPEVAEKTALNIFIKTYQKKYKLDVSSIQVKKPELWIYNPLLFGKNEDITYLVWRMEVTPKEMLPIRELVLVDAKFGNVVLHFNQNPTALDRLIYDHANIVGKPLPGLAGDLRRSEGQPPTCDQPSTCIEDVDNAYDYAGDTYNFYWNYHDRDSIDDAGMQLISTTRYCPGYPYPCPFPNAFWLGDPYYQMVYGEGFASADDVVAHEMTHGVTEHESNLIYLGQSGAINESFSDIWGEFVDLTNEKGIDIPTVRWLMGEDIGAIRSMKNPPAYGHPDRIWSTYYYCGECDQGGVHTNSGVGNKAAYLMTDGGTFNGITVMGIGITKIAKIFYEVQTNLLISSSDYEDLANALWQACMNLVGTDGITTLDCNQVVRAINATQMNHEAPTNLVLNPGFESGRGVGWTEYSSGSYDIIQQWIDPSANDCGDWIAWLGGYYEAVDYIYQDITIPSNATQASFQFFYSIDTDEWVDVAYDKMVVEVRRASDDVLLKTLLTLSNRNACFWKKSAQYDLLSFKGQTIRLMFYATNDYKYHTNFYVDDVVVKVGAKNTPAITSFKINSGAASTAKGKVTLNNVATNKPTHYMASEKSDFSDAIWQAYSTAPSFILSTGTGMKTVYFKVKNNFNESLVMNDTIEALKPVVTSFKINRGAASTAKGLVTLNNVATNSPTHYMASEDPGFGDADWKVYSTAPSFTLSDKKGSKKVYFKVKNSFADALTVSDSISAVAPGVTSFKINSGAVSTTKGLVTLNNVATNLPTYYMASEDLGFVGGTWLPYSTAPSFALSGGPGERTVYFKVKNSVDESVEVSDTILLFIPAVTSFKINGGAASTTNPVVKLNNVATNLPTQYKASELSNFSDVPTWLPYSTAPSFTLSGSPGTKTVYFKVQNSSGESAVVSDTIVLSVPAVTSFKINGGAASTTNPVVKLNNVATNAPTQYKASELSDFSDVATWLTYSTAPSFTLSSGKGEKRVYFKVKNGSGESPVVSDTISALAPAVTTFDINSGAASTTNPVVKLNNVATNAPTHYMASENPGFVGAIWLPYSIAPSFALSGGPGEKTVYFKVKNSVDESPVVTDDILVDGSAPLVTSFKINAGATSTANGLVTLNNACTNRPMYYIASESPSFVGASWQAYSATPKFTLSAGSGTKTVYFKAQNIFGESSIVSDTIFLY